MGPIYIPIETKSREYLAKLLLAAHLVQHSAPVLLGERRTLHTLLPLLSPGVLVEKGVGFTGFSKFRRARAYGHTLVGWDEEGLVFDEDRYAFTADGRVISLLESFFAWGRHHKEFLASNFDLPTTNVTATGNPRIDIITRKWSYRPAATPMILFNDNFPFVNHFSGPGHLEAHLQQYVWGHPERSTEDKRRVERTVREIVRCKQLLFSKFLYTIRKASRALPRCAIVVRPHPSSNPQTFLDECSDLSNVRVSAEGPVEDWISTARAVIHSGCTTGIQSFIIGAPTFAIVDRDASTPGEELPNAVSHRFEDVDVLVERLVGQVQDGESCDEPQDRKTKYKVLTHYLASLSMQPDGAIYSAASERIAEQIARIASNESHSTTRRLRLSSSTTKDAHGILSMLLSKQSDPYLKQKFPGITDSEIRKDLADFGVDNVEVKPVMGTKRRVYRLSHV